MYMVRLLLVLKETSVEVGCHGIYEGEARFSGWTFSGCAKFIFSREKADFWWAQKGWSHMGIFRCQITICKYHNVDWTVG